MCEQSDFIKGRRLSDAEALALLWQDPIVIDDDELDKIIDAFEACRGHHTGQLQIFRSSANSDKGGHHGNEEGDQTDP